MAKKDYFLIVDTESTQDGLVADFAAVIVDRKGKIHAQCAVLVNGIFTDREKHPLFHTSDKNLWGAVNLPKRYAAYDAMVEGGTRIIASIGAINRWLEKALEKYNPFLTAYNVSFDRDVCAKTGIDLTQFTAKTFCLWYAAAAKFGQTKAYRAFVLDVHAFGTPTAKGNMTYKTNAETMARFVLNNPRLSDEPHTALEDVLYYELPILLKLVNSSKKEEWLNPPRVDWKNFQVKNHFKAK